MFKEKKGFAKFLLAALAPLSYVIPMHDLSTIRKLVGDVTSEQLRYVDSFVGGPMGIFIPVVGPCFYAITPEHSHPAYSFILAFDDNCEVCVDGRIIMPAPGEVMAIDPEALHHEVPSKCSPGTLQY